MSLACAKLRVWNGIIDAFGRGEIGPLLGARRKDMPGIFDDERRGTFQTLRSRRLS
jgi:hypothetical protein